jgi:hypothetical protein
MVALVEEVQRAPVCEERELKHVSGQLKITAYNQRRIMTCANYMIKQPCGEIDVKDDIGKQMTEMEINGEKVRFPGYVGNEMNGHNVIYTFKEVVNTTLYEENSGEDPSFGKGMLERKLIHTLRCTSKDLPEYIVSEESHSFIRDYPEKKD